MLELNKCESISFRHKISYFSELWFTSNLGTANKF